MEFNEDENDGANIEGKMRMQSDRILMMGKTKTSPTAHDGGIELVNTSGVKRMNS